MKTAVAYVEKEAVAGVSEVTDLAQDGPALALVPSPAKSAETLAEKPQILEELLIEEVSIDGMCGVY